MSEKSKQQNDLQKWKEIKKHVEECEFNDAVYSDLLQSDYRIPESFEKIMEGLFCHVKRIDSRLAEITGMLQRIDERIRTLESESGSTKS